VAALLDALVVFRHGTASGEPEGMPATPPLVNRAEYGLDCPRLLHCNDVIDV